MQYGAHLPLVSFEGEQRSLADLRAYASAARDLGFDYLCANDHLVFARPWLDGPTALAAVLADAGEMRLATTVALPTVRGPAALAKAATTLQWLSEGRLTLGIGPGSSARDYALAGVPFEERWGRFHDSIRVLRALLDGGQHEGTYYGTRDETFGPRWETPPPIWLGSWGSDAGLRRVARLGDGWLASGYNTTPAEFALARTALEERTASMGRASLPNAIATLWTYVTDDRGEAERVLTGLLAPMLNRPVDELREKLPIGSAEECAEKLAALASAGAERLFVWPVTHDLEQLRRIAQDVRPLLEVATRP